MIAPLLALIVWTLIMLAWLYVRRIPAMIKHHIDPDQLKTKAGLRLLPPEAQAVAENYNHLFEQPTLFYALCLSIQLGAMVDETFRILAWIYVSLRVVHSLIQAYMGSVIFRFLIFICATAVLVLMTYRAAMAVWF